MKFRLLRYLLSLTLDYSVIFFLTYVLWKSFEIFFIVDYLYVYFILSTVCVLYYLGFYFYTETTIGKYIFNIKLKINHKHRLSALLLREIGLKYFFSLIFFIILKFSISSFIDAVRFLLVVFFVISFLFLVKIVFIQFKKQSTFDIFLKTKYSFDVQEKNKSIYVKYIFLYFTILLFTILINNVSQNSKFSFLGVTLPQKFPEYPYKFPKEYTDFVKQQKDAKDYVFSLFEKNDIVILCEPNHAEIKTWKFISELVTDKRFIDKVGHVFTEYGAVNQQSVLDSFINNNHKNIEKEASKVTDYFNTGFFNYMVNLNKCNTNLPDSLKIKHLFCDIDGIHDFGKYKINEFEYSHRDSFLANVVIDNYLKFHKKRNKCLVVTNYRHAYNLFQDVPENQAEYIFKAIPNKTANVLLNSYSMNMFFLYYPILHGKWDKILSDNKKQIGFNFKNSPFGKEEFDHFVKFKKGIKYQDVFTGFIYTYPLKDWVLDQTIPYTNKHEYLYFYLIISLYNLTGLFFSIFFTILSILILILIFMKYRIMNFLRKNKN